MPLLVLHILFKYMHFLVSILQVKSGTIQEKKADGEETNNN